MSILAAVSGYFILAVDTILDKFLVANARVKPAVVVFYGALTLLPILAAVPLGWVAMIATRLDLLVAIISGVSFVLGWWAMYQGFEYHEASHLGPLIGAATPFFVIIISAMFLPEALTRLQYIAVALLIIGSLVISYEVTRRGRGWPIGMLWGVAAGCLYAISSLTAKYIFSRYGFWSGLVWSKGTAGITAVFLLAHPDVLRNIRDSIKKFFLRSRPAADQRRVSFDIIIFGTNRMLGLVGTGLVQFALFLGSPTIVNGLAGVQYALLILMVMALSWLFPRLFKEDYTRGEIIQEAMAVMIIAAGLGLLLA